MISASSHKLAFTFREYQAIASVAALLADTKTVDLLQQENADSFVFLFVFF